MAHFAKLDDNNVVLEVIVVHNNELLDENGNENEEKGIQFLIEWSGGYSKWKQTSYNRNFRKHYAGPGYTYDHERDVFIPPKIYDSWIFDETDVCWKPPLERPRDDKIYNWDEDTVSWKEFIPPT